MAGGPISGSWVPQASTTNLGPAIMNFPTSGIQDVGLAVAASLGANVDGYSIIMLPATFPSGTLTLYFRAASAATGNMQVQVAWQVYSAFPANLDSFSPTTETQQSPNIAVANQEYQFSQSLTSPPTSGAVFVARLRFLTASWGLSSATVVMPPTLQWV